MARFQLSDALLERVEVRANTAPHHLLTVLAWADGAPPEGSPWQDAGDLPGVGALFRFTSWGPVARFADCAARRRDWVFNADAFRFAENRDGEDTTFEQVLMSDYGDRADASYVAFDLLCSRAFAALQAFAAARSPETQDAAWWPKFLSDAAVVAARLAQ